VMVSLVQSRGAAAPEPAVAAAMHLIVCLQHLLLTSGGVPHGAATALTARFSQV
jgi:hypothetical protein